MKIFVGYIIHERKFIYIYIHTTYIQEYNNIDLFSYIHSSFLIKLNFFF